MVFDYGDYNKDIPRLDDDVLIEKNGVKTDNWKEKARKDPFSSHRSGFEIRNYRLCKRVLMFHTFSELNAAMPTLVHSLDFDYLSSSEVKVKSNPYAEVTYLMGMTSKGYVWNQGYYSVKALPKMTFDYQWLQWNTNVKNVSKENLVHAPVGLSGNYQWVDLYNEGINGILTEQANGWFYKSNLGQNTEGSVQFAHAQQVMPKPSFLGLSNGVLQLQDLDANGEKQIVVTSQGLQGYFELNFEGGTQNSKPETQNPNTEGSQTDRKSVV